MRPRRQRVADRRRFFYVRLEWPLGEPHVLPPFARLYTRDSFFLVFRFFFEVQCWGLKLCRGCVCSPLIKDCSWCVI